MEKKKVLVSGCNGHMGRIVCSLIAQTDDMKVVAGFDLVEDTSGSFPVFNSYVSLYDWSAGSHIIPDVIIDFSSPDATKTILQYAYAYKIPIVIATTGLSEATIQEIKDMSEKFSIFQSPNMSIQVAMVTKLLKEIAWTIPKAEVEITETHHNRKKDAPSGTAKMFASAIKSVLDKATNAENTIIYGREGKRQEHEIGMCSKRGGNIVGTHTIEFFSPFETLEITHTAHSRELFADGAIQAARYILNFAAGLFTMDDLVKD